MNKYTDKQIIKFAEELVGSGVILDTEYYDIIDNATENQHGIFD